MVELKMENQWIWWPKKLWVLCGGVDTERTRVFETKDVLKTTYPTAANTTILKKIHEQNNKQIKALCLLVVQVAVEALLERLGRGHPRHLVGKVQVAVLFWVDGGVCVYVVISVYMCK